jgi:UrcA family protein
VTQPEDEIMTLKTISLAAAVLALTATAAPANPLNSTRTVTVKTTVSFADLDIRQELGASILLDRISSAAENLCGPASNEFGPVRSFHTCVDDAIAHAVTMVNSPVVSALYSGQSGTTVIAKNN